MVVTCYRAYCCDEEGRPCGVASDSWSLFPPKDDNVYETVRVVLPEGYTLSSNTYGEPMLFDEKECGCELCVPTPQSHVVLAISSTRAKALRFAEEGEEHTPLQEARIAAGLTQQQLADATGVNIRQIQRLELGESQAGNVTAKNILAIARAVGVEPETLICNSD